MAYRGLRGLRPDSRCKSLGTRAIMSHLMRSNSSQHPHPMNHLESKGSYAFDQPSSNLFIVGARGYIGRPLLASAKTVGSAIGTSSIGGNGLLHLRLDAPSDFDYGRISPSDFVMVTAAISAPDVCAREHDWAWKVNVTGTSSFIQSVIDCGARVVFFSSDTTYGERDDEFDETTVSNPAGEYAIMKHEIECQFSNCPSFKSIRLSYVFSKADKFSRYLAECAERNEEAELFHPFFRAIVHRVDVVEGAILLAKHWDEVPEKIINFGGPQVLSRIDFAECLRDAYLNKLRFKVTQPSDDFFRKRPRNIAMKSPLFHKLLGRSPSTFFDATLLEFAAF